LGAADRVETGWVEWRRRVLGLTPQATYGRPHSGAEEGFPDSHSEEEAPQTRPERFAPESWVIGDREFEWSPITREA